MTPSEKLQKFLEDEGLTLRVLPEFIPRDDGTFSLVVKAAVAERDTARPLEPNEEEDATASA